MDSFAILLAGENRKISQLKKEEQHNSAVNEGIVASIFWFVRALHDAGGDGRYPDKIRQAQQVGMPCTLNAHAART